PIGITPRVPSGGGNSSTPVADGQRSGSVRTVTRTTRSSRATSCRRLLPSFGNPVITRSTPPRAGGLPTSEPGLDAGAHDLIVMVTGDRFAAEIHPWMPSWTMCVGSLASYLRVTVTAAAQGTLPAPCG